MTITEAKRARSQHQPVGRWIRVDKRLAIYLRDGFYCLVCGTDLHGSDPRQVTLDHVQPKARGGSNGEENLYTCCVSCNSARGDKPLAKFAPPAAVKRIARHRRRKLARYRHMAKAILAGDLDYDEVR